MCFGRHLTTIHIPSQRVKSLKSVFDFTTQWAFYQHEVVSFLTAHAHSGHRRPRHILISPQAGGRRHPRRESPLPPSLVLAAELARAAEQCGLPGGTDRRGVASIHGESCRAVRASVRVVGHWVARSRAGGNQPQQRSERVGDGRYGGDGGD